MSYKSIILRGVIILQAFSWAFFSCSQSNNSKTKEHSKISNQEITVVFKNSLKINTAEKSSAEIVAFDKDSKKLFVVNSAANYLDIVEFKNLESIKILKSVNLSSYGGGLNSVAVKNGIVAIAMENFNKQTPGSVCFFNTDGEFKNKVNVGAQPDMLTFTPDGRKILVANEGEPTQGYDFDPEGSISIIELPKDLKQIKQEHVLTLDFRKFNDSASALIKRGIRITGPNASVAQDLEPEYVSVSPDQKKAFVSLQENNAIAVIDLSNKVIERIYSLGESSYQLNNNSSLIVKGYFQPDGICSYEVDGKTYILTANEGDSRKFDNYEDAVKLKNKSYSLDQFKFPDSKKLKEDLGKTNVAIRAGDIDGDGDIDEVFCFGTRSFSIWNSQFQRIYDSGNDFENIACRNQDYCKFNECYVDENENGTIQNPQPESVTIGKIADKTYAFISLERYGGIIVYNVTNPNSPQFIQYINSTTGSKIEDQSRPEGILFIPEKDSPSGKNLILVANEGISTIDIYEIQINK